MRKLSLVAMLPSEALWRDLGAAGMVRFLQQFEPGHSDYTAERRQWLPSDVNVDSLAEAIRQETTGHEQPPEA